MRVPTRGKRRLRKGGLLRRHRAHKRYLCRRVAAIIHRCADIVPRRAMLVVASRRMGMRERRESRAP